MKNHPANSAVAFGSFCQRIGKNLVKPLQNRHGTADA
jgi:glutamate mutase epsilon subunit